MDLIRVSVGGRLFDIPSDELSERTKERLAEISNGENIEILELLQAFLEEAEITNTLQNALNAALARIDSIESSTNPNA